MSHATWKPRFWLTAGVLALAVTALSALGLPAKAEQQAALVCAPSTSKSILVTVENVRSSDGLITAVLYGDDPDTFLKRGARVDRTRVVAKVGLTALCLTAPTVGDYSVAVYHDENANKKFDRGFIGLPTEGFGFSSNPGLGLGKPDLAETLFEVRPGTTDVNISIRYLVGD